jgi:RNA polymerase sigma-70 factor (ECF subfamily)
LYGIARNLAAAERRRAARALDAEARIAGHRLLDQDDIARLEERIDAERSSRLVLNRIAELPETQRAVLELTAIDGLTPSQTAAVLGISAVAVRVRLHRARHALNSDAPPEPAIPLTPLAEAR